MSATTMQPDIAIDGALNSTWRRWLSAWCVLVALFGLLLCGAAFPATDAPARTLFATMGGMEVTVLDRPLRFAVALMGAVTIGWGLTIAAAAPAIERLAAPDRQSAWRAVSGAVVTWFVIDSALSIATGFSLNAVSNALLMAGFAVPLIAGRALVE